MKEKKFYFIAGLPRSGSTLLCNILNQNPRFHATATSGVIDLLLLIRNNWENIGEFKASPNDLAKMRVMRSVLPAFYNDIQKPVIFEKSRGWPAQLEMLESLLGHNAKILVPVRDIRDVLASFEKIWRKDSAHSLIPQERAHMDKFGTVEGRCEVWLKPNQPVGKAYNNIKDSLVRGYGERMHFVFFDELTTNPKPVLRGVYDFLGEPYFEHNFDNVEQTIHENDRMHGFSDLHTIRNRVAPVPSQWKQVLGSWAEKYGQLNFWETAIRRKKNQ
jgi:sulfotransferase